MNDLAPPGSPIRVVVADDSPFVCRLLTSYLHSVPGIEVVGTALNGRRAIELVKELRPHAITLDLQMPDVDGLQALAQIMREAPTPVIIVSGVSNAAAQVTLNALNMGAVDFILKYTPGVDTDPEVLRQEIIAKVRTAARVKVIRTLDSNPAAPVRPSSRLPDASSLAGYFGRDVLPGGVVVIGASTGGPTALRDLLCHLPANFAAAIVVVQHMPASFTGVLAAQLNRSIDLKVKEAEVGDRLRPGLVLVAPGGYHLLLGADARVELNQGPAIQGHRPSINVTMQSAAMSFGARVRGVVLTGMGDDGTLGLVSIRTRGGKTFAQDAATCVVNGMPQRAVDRGVVDHVAAPARIAEMLMRDAGETE